MFPLRDENPSELVPFVTFALIAANVLVWIMVQGAGMGAPFIASLCQYGTIPGELTGAVAAGSTIPLGPDATCTTGGLTWSTVLTSMFLHGSWMHLIGNMWFLWVFGNNIEDSTGHVRYLVFYLLCGALAAGAHILSSPDSLVPTVGASGAISGIMGAYLVLYPKVRVHVLIFLFVFIRVIPMTAAAVLLIWFGLQVLSGTMVDQGGAGVAFWAHIGGFVAGAVLIKLFAKPVLTDAKRRGVKLTRAEMGRMGPW